MERRATVNPEVIQAAEFKIRAVAIKDSELKLTIDQIGPNFPNSLRGFETNPMYGALWVNPEESSISVPAIIITQDGIKKTTDRRGQAPDLHDLKQLSHADYEKYFQKGLELLKQFAQIEMLRKKPELEPQELKELVHLIWQSGGGSEDDNSDGIMEFAGDPQIQVTTLSPEFNYTDIEIYNGIANSPGEIVKLFEDEENGALFWKIGINDTFYSRLLKKPIEIEGRPDPGHILFSEKKLSGNDLGKIGKILADKYIHARNKGILPSYS